MFGFVTSHKPAYPALHKSYGIGSEKYIVVKLKILEKYNCKQILERITLTVDSSSYFRVEKALLR